MYSGATPEFIDGDVFKTKISLNEANRSDGGVNGGVSGGVSGGVKLSEINREVLECIKENGEFNAEKIAEKIKRGKRTVERAIKSLKEQGMGAFARKTKVAFSRVILYPRRKNDRKGRAVRRLQCQTETGTDDISKQLFQ